METYAGRLKSVLRQPINLIRARGACIAQRSHLRFSPSGLMFESRLDSTAQFVDSRDQSNPSSTNNGVCCEVSIFLQYSAHAFAALHLQNPLHKHQMGLISLLSTNHVHSIEKITTEPGFKPGASGANPTSVLCRHPSTTKIP